MRKMLSVGIVIALISTVFLMGNPVSGVATVWKLGDRVVPGPLPPNSYAGLPKSERILDIKYGDESEWQVFDFARPVVCEGQTIPLVIFFHGDGFSHRVTKDGGLRNPPSIQFLQLGFAVASVDYRVIDDAAFPALVHDCKLAVRYFRKNADEFGIDPDRIAVWGSSMGGYLSAFLGYVNDDDGFEGIGLEDVSSSVSVIVDYFGVKAVGRIDTKQAVPNRPRFVGEKAETPEFKEKAFKASPINYVDENDPPTLMIHGNKDTKVNYEQSILFAQKNFEVGNNVALIKVENAEHGFDPVPADAVISPPNERIWFATVAHIARYVEPDVFGDINLDGKKNIDDLLEFAKVYGLSGTDEFGNSTSAYWNPLADLEPDGKIDIKDWNKFKEIF